jgi:hypothetical protein
MVEHIMVLQPAAAAGSGVVGLRGTTVGAGVRGDETGDEV